MEHIDGYPFYKRVKRLLRVYIVENALLNCVLCGAALFFMYTWNHQCGVDNVCGCDLTNKLPQNFNVSNQCVQESDIKLIPLDVITSDYGDSYSIILCQNDTASIYFTNAILYDYKSPYTEIAFWNMSNAKDLFRFYYGCIQSAYVYCQQDEKGHKIQLHSTKGDKTCPFFVHRYRFKVCYNSKDFAVSKIYITQGTRMWDISLREIHTLFSVFDYYWSVHEG